MIPDNLKDGVACARLIMDRWGELARAEKIDGAEGMSFESLDDVTKATLIEAVREIVTRPLAAHALEQLRDSRPTPPMFDNDMAAPPTPSLFDCYVCGKERTTIKPGRPCYSCAGNP